MPGSSMILHDDFNWLLFVLVNQKLTSQTHEKIITVGNAQKPQQNSEENAHFYKLRTSKTNQ